MSFVDKSIYCACFNILYICIYIEYALRLLLLLQFNSYNAVVFICIYLALL